MDIECLEMMLKINEEKKSLEELGLDTEEVEGYIDFFIDNWLPTQKILQKARDNVQN